jgi:putative nucleotidyltransferase with HDIG domain
VGLTVFILPIVMMYFSIRTYVERTERSVGEFKRMNLELQTANVQIKNAGAAIQRLNKELFITLGKIIDARDPYVLDHASQVATYAVSIGKQMGLDDKRLEMLQQAAYLHDIGKIGIPDSILQKPGTLTGAEYQLIQKHSMLGASFLETCEGLRHLAPFVRHHHERWDGNGYPDGLKGEQIPLEARILSVCDAVEAMSSDRPYHLGSPFSETVREVQRCRNTQFDPAVVDAFLSIVAGEGKSIVVNTSRSNGARRAPATLPLAAETPVPLHHGGGIQHLLQRVAFHLR